MFCKWCGMESVTATQCSWCHHGLSSGQTEGNAEADVPAPAAAKTHAPPVSLRQSARPPDPEPVPDAEDIPLAAKTAAPPGTAQTQESSPSYPAPGKTSATEDELSHARPIIGVRRPGARPGSRLPAPSMPPIRTSTDPSARPAVGSGAAPRPHLPAPGIPAVMMNRAGGAAGRLPAPSLPGVVRRPAAGVPAVKGEAPPTKAPSSRPAVPAALASARTTAPMTDFMPAAEPGGLADGVSAPASAAQISAEMHVPAMGTFTPARSKYYPGTVVDPTSGTHYDAESGKPVATPVAKPASSRTTKKTPDPDVEIVWDKPPTTMSSVVVRYLAAYVGLLIVGGLTAYFLPGYYAVPLVLIQFLGGLLLPIMGVAPWQRDDSDDVPGLILLILVFGPVIGLIIYGVMGLLRRDANPAVVGCLIVSTLAFLTIKLPLDHNLITHVQTLLQVTPPWLQQQVGQPFEIKTLFVNWSALLAMAGWYTANVFHKLDE